METAAVSQLTADQILFLSFITPGFLGSGLFLIIRDLPVVKRYLGEVA